jgi:hypothetical protein
MIVPIISAGMLMIVVIASMQAVIMPIGMPTQPVMLPLNNSMQAATHPIGMPTQADNNSANPVVHAVIMPEQVVISIVSPRRHPGIHSQKNPVRQQLRHAKQPGQQPKSSPIIAPSIPSASSSSDILFKFFNILFFTSSSFYFLTQNIQIFHAI